MKLDDQVLYSEHMEREFTVLDLRILMDKINDMEFITPNTPIEGIRLKFTNNPVIVVGDKNGILIYD